MSGSGVSTEAVDRAAIDDWLRERESVSARGGGRPSFAGALRSRAGAFGRIARDEGWGVAVRTAVDAVVTRIGSRA
ncbi:hypothetical protein [Homoserinibacter sp. GY 40078]|uniref:hypothetical protein n=1 Tax=Homoserinibacter sp. GY 40078 TaxID=2603275 RepID=UPI0011CB9BFE|nr:hypothetical protein [Homoserinibacter sp. GY 40078]TXK16258.1 hypothetical protein FVQ89_13455 [Homoserinibacter sp. GY 40078]